MRSTHRPTLVTAPSVLPVSVADVKTARGITTSSDDTLIGNLISAVVSDLDGWSGRLGRAMVNQTWSQAFDSFNDEMRLPLLASSITSITYVDTAGSTQTLSSSVYRLRADGAGSYVELAPDQAWPSTSTRSQAVTVTFVCGFGATAADVPAGIRQAIIMLTGGLYQVSQRDASMKKEVIEGVGSREWDVASAGKDYALSAANSLLSKYVMVGS